MVGFVDPEVNAHLLNADGVRQGRDDHRDRCRRFDLGELVDEAVQPFHLPPGRRVGVDPGHHRHHVVRVELGRRTIGHHPAVAEHDDPVGEAEDLLDAVRHE